MRHRLLPLAAALAAAGAQATGAAAQRADSVVVVAGERYDGGLLKRFLLGESYRDLWTAPVRVPLLDLGSFAGGLTPTETGGGNQTLSLRFRGADGREYAFRSVDKQPGRSDGSAGGPLAALLQDQVSSQNPAAGIVTGGLMDATGTLHVDAQLFVMPDDPRLGEFRERFAGMLGQMEERVGDGFAGSPDVVDTEDIFPALQAAGGRNRLAAEELLVIRLMDLVLGDWDRHEDQYEWARFDQPGGIVLWRPVARDRDYAFVDYDGLLLDMARPFMEKAVRFRPRYGDVYGLIEQGQYLDRRLLGELDRADWERAAAGLRARLTDRVIDDAVRRMPPEYQRIEGARLAAFLRGRRERLPAAAAAFYRMMAREPEAHGTDGADLAVVDRLADGGMEVRIYAGGEEAGEPFYHRRFVRGETREVRVFLHGGDDRAVVRGEGGVLVRVMGGAGDDRMEDAGRGDRTVFHDDAGRNQFVRGSNTVVDTRPFDDARYEMAEGDPAVRAVDPPRDWGMTTATLSPFVAVRPFADAVVGLGPAATRFGFRRYPWAERWHARALWAPLHGRFGAEARYTRRWTGGDDRGFVFVRASELEASYFTGWGNDTGAPEGVRHYVLWERQALLEPGVTLVRPGGLTVEVAGVLRYTDPQPGDADTPAGAQGGFGIDEGYFAAGARAGAAIDRRDEAGFPRRGWTLAAQGELFPLASESLLGDGERDGRFGRVGATGTSYLPLGPAVVALRAGGQKVVGDFPLQYAAFLGGSPSVRGYSFNRYAGDAAAFGSAEVRMRLFGPLGALALGDAGRVWYEGDSEGGWHTALGGGAFVTAGGYTASVVYAHGERGIVYLRLGLPF